MERSASKSPQSIQTEFIPQTIRSLHFHRVLTVDFLDALTSLLVRERPAAYEL